ncbi:MAG: ATP-binding protein [Vallitalea sp.]|jgi:serine/threonine-protein kinase RsbW|nr:ATP-binding protein [Vallitalea sp.]
MKKYEFILHGLDNCKEIIELIITNLKRIYNNINYFDIKLILTEGLTNAFKHGNKNNKEKPIFLRYYLKHAHVIFEIEDSGNGVNGNIPDSIPEENILNNQGRGLYLINVIADELQVKGNCLIIKKYLQNQLVNN